MSDLDYKLRCPFCNEGLLFWGATGSWRKCPKCDNNLIGNEELWHALIDTKKKLDIAVDALDTVRQYKRGTAVIRPDDIAEYCDRKIEQINEIKGGK